MTLTDNLENKAFVIVKVQDINDHAPVFQISPYKFSISSQTPIGGTSGGTYVGTVMATDNDFLSENRQVRYSLFGIPGPLGFRVTSSGELYIENSPRDYAGQTINTTIAATDGPNGVTVVAMVTVIGSLTTPPATTTPTTTTTGTF